MSPWAQLTARVLLLTCAVISPLVSTQAQAQDQQQSEQQLSRLLDQIRKLKNTITGTLSQRDNAQQSLQEVEREIGKLAREQRQIEASYRGQQSKLQQLENRQRELNIQQQNQKALIAKQLRSAYMLGNESQLKMLLNQQDPNAVSRMMGYYDYFNKARRQQLENYRQTLVEIQELIPKVNSATLELAAQKTALDKQEQQLNAKKSDRANIVAQLDSKLANQKDSLSDLDRQRQELEGVLKALTEEITEIIIPESYLPFAKMRGKMAWPAAGKRLNNYGAPRQGSAVKWQGVQIAAQEGDTVKAIHNGRVVYADWLRGSGLLLILDHGGEYLSLYAHNQSLLRGEGEWVKAGEAIATVGNSGGRQQNGLYFEIRHKGKPTNPYRWCR
ncbi:peptidoglycan DD-metalloendopeptidase family protein [Spongiibacter sp. KMU-158]|uniref:Peptidoglycan DD-metalloendopeptidase family protein n=1 Tax=Spongiibacter pelagi TaxID=2760804 RepID=A0A927GY10_9GAMM|nr:peptidoglycan DD-metalloendopeptidase family protein [Spongiibacter pelagi]MBD2859969.1 peptidoglycan DD-metalloendopeptidase family protein [Spongiibacter pelagi]